MPKAGATKMVSSTLVASINDFKWSKYDPITGLQKEDSGLRSETFVFVNQTARIGLYLSNSALAITLQWPVSNILELWCCYFRYNIVSSS